MTRLSKTCVLRSSVLEPSSACASSATQVRGHRNAAVVVSHVCLMLPLQPRPVRVSPETGQSRGYAFVEYTNEADFVRAFQHAHGLVLDGAKLLVDWERGRLMPGWLPRRLGGGLGGRKESGQLRFGGRDCPFRTFFSPDHVA